MIKKLFKTAAMVLIAYPAWGVEIMRDDENSFTVGGRIAVLGSNTESFNKAGNLLNLKDGGSRINMTGTYKITDSTVASGFIEWGFDSQASSNSSFLKNRYGYIAIDNNRLGTVKIGKVFSVVNDIVIGSTVDNLFVGTNDAGLSSFYGGEGSDVSTSRLKSALVYDKKYGNFRVGLQYQGKTMIVDKGTSVGAIEKKYGLGGALSYDNGFIIASAGYIHNENSKSQSNPIEYKDSALNTNVYLASAGVKFSGVKITTAGGYYQNYNILGQDHVGASLYAEYTLDKITPYLGFEVIYGLDANKVSSKTGGLDIAGLDKRSSNVNHSMDRQNIALGAAYKATSHLYLIAEWNYDLRSKSARESSVLNPKQNKDVSLLVRYNF